MQYLESVVQAVRRETVELDREMRARAAEGGAAPAGPKGLPPSVAPAGEDELGVVVSLSVGELSIEQYERLYRWGGAGGAGGRGGAGREGSRESLCRGMQAVRRLHV